MIKIVSAPLGMPLLSCVSYTISLKMRELQKEREKKSSYE